MKIKIFLIIAVINLLSVSIFAQSENFNRRKDLAATKLLKVGSGESAGVDAGQIAEVKINKDRRGKKEPCKILFDNMTGWIVKVYVNGNYRGTVAAYDEMTIHYDRGLTRIYARVDFGDGTYKYWGPTDVRCNEHNPYIRIVP